MFRLFAKFGSGAAAAGWIISRNIYIAKDSVCEGVTGAVGNTPMIRIKSLSEATGCDILVKAEHLNPGGSIKDRPAAYMIQHALDTGKLKPGGTLIEATAGNTGVGLALLSKQFGLDCIFTLPQKTSQEKINNLQRLGAQTIVCPMVPFGDPQHFQSQAKTICDNTPNSYYVNQFDNRHNAQAHFETTAPEIWNQTKGKVDAFVYSPGTGGTLCGVSKRLKQYNHNIQVYAAHPSGVSLTLDDVSTRPNFVNYRPMTDEEKKRVSAPSTILEGIGPSKYYINLKEAEIDGEVRYNSDVGAVAMCRYLTEKEGLHVGGSAGLNILAAYHLAKKIGPGHTIVSVVCDGGERYASTVYDKEFLKQKNIECLHPLDRDLKWADSQCCQPAHIKKWKQV